MPPSVEPPDRPRPVRTTACRRSTAAALAARGVSLRAAAAVGAGLIALPAATAAAQGPGGAYSAPAPAIESVRCSSSCTGIARVVAGSTIRIEGEYLRGAAAVVFLGAGGAGDDVRVAPAAGTEGTVEATVPAGVVSGPVAVEAEGGRSRPSKTSLVVDAGEARQVGGGGGPLLETQVIGRRVFFGAERQAQYAFTLAGSQPATVAVELVRSSDGVSITRWDLGQVAPGVPQVVSWDGRAGGKVQREGRYQFRLYARDGSGAVASTAQADDPADAKADSFVFLRHRFPIAGRHDYGGPVAEYGGGRRHQGQDIFAACGTPLVAARGGTVKFAAYHARAGHYVIIDGDATGVDYVYMHMAARTPFKKGDVVRTGQQIGAVGDTGHADGCHLHFELHSAPGWYTGGSSFDPLPHLRAWDKFS